jgi:hypothetical protein
MSESKMATKKKTRKSNSSKKHTQPRQATSKAIPAEKQQHRINEAAYFIAEQRGFTPGFELNDWLCAESQIDNNPAQ